MINIQNKEAKQEPHHPLENQKQNPNNKQTDLPSKKVNLLRNNYMEKFKSLKSSSNPLQIQNVKTASNGTSGCSKPLNTNKRQG